MPFCFASTDHVVGHSVVTGLDPRRPKCGEESPEARWVGTPPNQSSLRCISLLSPSYRLSDPIISLLVQDESQAYDLLRFDVTAPSFVPDLSFPFRFFFLPSSFIYAHLFHCRRYLV